MAKKIIFDTDIGVDDAFAARYATKMLDVVGITTVNGNCRCEQATKNAKLFCEKYGLSTPVYRGATRPLSVDPLVPSYHIHGRDGMGQCYENNLSDEAPDAVDFIIKTVMENKGEITIVAVGPLTNIALALSICPEIAKHTKLVIMGGAYGFDGFTGNMSHFAEFNIYVDPHAADQVFRSGIDVSVIPLDVTCKVLITREEIAATKDQFLIDISDFYLKFCKEAAGFDGITVHDALATTFAYDPSFFTIVDKPCRVSCEGITFGQTVIPRSRIPVPTDCFKDVKPAHICADVDVERIRKHLLEVFSK